MRCKVNKCWRVSHVACDIRNKFALWNQGLSISTRTINTMLASRSRFHNVAMHRDAMTRSRLANRLDGSRHFYDLLVRLGGESVQNYWLDFIRVALTCRHFTDERWSTPELHHITALLLSVVRKALHLEIDRAFAAVPFIELNRRLNIFLTFVRFTSCQLIGFVVIGLLPRIVSKKFLVRIHCKYLLYSLESTQSFHIFFYPY